MSSTTATEFALPKNAPSAARRVLQLLERLRHGTLTVQLPTGESRCFGSGRSPHATITLNDWSACAAALRSGDIGFAEGYISGGWSSPLLTDLLRVLVRNRREFEDLVYGHWAGRLFYRLRHRLHRNNRDNSRKNVHAHYDLGNAFYQTWLDETMNYSAAWFDGAQDGSLKDAQDAKVRRALRMVGAGPGSRLLEIGCGWGALAEMAAVEVGASITGVTLSTEQLGFARARMERLGVADRVDLRLQDYRDIADKPFDAICSIEMVEAVGRDYWPVYFQSVARLLKPGGRACIQTIVIDDALWDRYIRSTDFIQQYIFPGGCLPCPREFRREAAAAGLRVVDELAFGADYAETLRRWQGRFAAERAEVLRQGFDERFIRTWDFYLAYCEAAFTEQNVDVFQYTLAHE